MADIKSESPAGLHRNSQLIKAISDGVGALRTRDVEKDKLEIEARKRQLEAAKWPKLSDIAAQ